MNRNIRQKKDNDLMTQDNNEDGRIFVISLSLPSEEYDEDKDVLEMAYVYVL